MRKQDLLQIEFEPPLEHPSVAFVVEGLLGIKLDKVLRGAAQLCKLVQSKAIRHRLLSILNELDDIIVLSSYGAALTLENLKFVQKYLPLNRFVHVFVRTCCKFAQIEVEDCQSSALLLLSQI